MLNRMAFQLFRQMCEKTFTNTFPVPSMPDSLTDAFREAEEGRIELHPPVETQERFRGRLNYDKSACIGCKLCIKVCPANATEFLPEEKKIQIHNDRCCFCAQCTEICPVKCLTMSHDFLISSYDRKAQITTDTGKPVPKEIPAATDGENAAAAKKKKNVCRIVSDKCIGCTKCARNCPVGCISGKVKELHVIDESACIGCGKCSELCPKGAVEMVEIEVVQTIPPKTSVPETSVAGAPGKTADLAQDEKKSEALVQPMNSEISVKEQKVDAEEEPLPSVSKKEMKGEK